QILGELIFKPDHAIVKVQLVLLNRLKRAGRLRLDDILDTQARSLRCRCLVERWRGGVRGQREGSEAWGILGHGKSNSPAFSISRRIQHPVALRASQRRRGVRTLKYKACEVLLVVVRVKVVIGFFLIIKVGIDAWYPLF